MLRTCLLFSALLAVLLLLPAQASASRRVALVIGNSKYEHTSPLANPINDAQAISAALKRLGFDVVTATDVTHSGMAKPVGEFAERMRGADVALLFYAGHGLSFEGRNYIVPVDATADSAINVRLGMHPLDTITDEMARAAQINIVILDACRDNPLARSLMRSLGGTSRSTSVGRGLARIEQVGQQSFFLMATKDGEVASDGSGQHSPFAQALLDNIEQQDVELSELTRRVRKAVRTATADRQVPLAIGSLEESFYFKGGTGAAAAPPPARPSEDASSRRQSDELYWESVKDLDSVPLLQSYLDRFPNGEFAAIARAKIARINSPPAPSAPPPPAYQPPAPVATISPQMIEPPTRAQAPEGGGPACGWYAIYYCSQSSEVADQVAQGYRGYVVDTSSRRYPTFKAGWYCVVEGPMARNSAAALAQRAKGRFGTPYFKNAC